MAPAIRRKPTRKGEFLMNEFDRITKRPEDLGKFLASLPVLTGPWDEAFNRTYCDACQAEDCDACPHQAERNNPTWWLLREVANVRNHPAG